jgi:hypothetical protein
MNQHDRDQRPVEIEDVIARILFERADDATRALYERLGLFKRVEPDADKTP